MRQSAVFVCFPTCARAYFLTPDNANLSDIAETSQAGRFVHHIVGKSAAIVSVTSKTLARPDRVSDLNTLALIPARVTSARAETLEDVVFLSGAALSPLDLVLGRDCTPRGAVTLRGLRLLVH